jgi:hypothetical protein
MHALWFANERLNAVLRWPSFSYYASVSRVDAVFVAPLSRQRTTSCCCCPARQNKLEEVNEAIKADDASALHLGAGVLARFTRLCTMYQ